jgi:transposase-like protein
VCGADHYESRCPENPSLKKPIAEVLTPIPAAILDQIVRDGPLAAAEIEMATRRFKKAPIEGTLGAEFTHHLGYAPGEATPDLVTNHRNRAIGKTVLTDDGTVTIECLRDEAMVRIKAVYLVLAVLPDGGSGHPGHLDRAD